MFLLLQFMGQKKRVNLDLLFPIGAYLFFVYQYSSVIYSVLGLVILISSGFFYLRWEEIKTQKIGIIVLSIIAFTLPTLGLWQYLMMRDSGFVDISAYVCALWNLSRGNLHYSIAELNIFGTHANYTIVFWLPIFVLFGAIGLKIGKAICLLGAGGIILKDSLINKNFSPWGIAAILLSPSIASQFFFGFHPEFIAAPVLVYSFIAYRDEKFLQFLFCAAFLSYSKEVLTLAIGGLVLLAMVERRPWRWIIGPILLCTIQMAIYWYAIVPFFVPAGNGFSSLIPKGHAQLFENFFQSSTGFYFLFVFLPFLPLMVYQSLKYFLIPIPLLLFYSVFPGWTHDIWRHYPFPLAFLCSAGIILRAKIEIIPGKTLFLCFIMSLLCYPLWRPVFTVPLNEINHTFTLNQVLKAIPSNASVVVNSQGLDRFASRKMVNDWVYRTKSLSDFEFIVLDLSYNPAWQEKKNDLSNNLKSLNESLDWDCLIHQDSVYLFKQKL